MAEPDAYDDVTPDWLRAADGLCDAFEDEWRAGRRPRVETYLARASEAARATVLRELLSVDLHYRRRCGDRPTADDYLGRFPGDQAVVAGALGGHGAPTHR